MNKDGIYNNIHPYPFLIGESRYVDLKRKDEGVQQYVTYNLNRTNSMFKWDGLPDTINQRELELYLQTQGYAVLANVKPTKNRPEGIYILRGGLGGDLDEYYRPTIFTGANPHLGIDYQLKVNEDCVLIRNDTLMYGLIPLFNRVATMMVENDLTMFIQSIAMRMMALIVTNSDREKKAADELIKKLIDGEISAMAQSPVFAGVSTQPYANNTQSSNEIEYQQYLKATMFNDIGLDANYNMKRESLNSVEAQMNDDALSPYVDNMLNCRKIDSEKAKEILNLNLSVDFDSSWKLNDTANKSIQVDNGKTENNKTGE